MKWIQGSEKLFNTEFQWERLLWMKLLYCLNNISWFYRSKSPSYMCIPQVIYLWSVSGVMRGGGVGSDFIKTRRELLDNHSHLCCKHWWCKRIYELWPRAVGYLARHCKPSSGIKSLPMYWLQISHLCIYPTYLLIAMSTFHIYASNTFKFKGAPLATNVSMCIWQIHMFVTIVQPIHWVWGGG